MCPSPTLTVSAGHDVSTRWWMHTVQWRLRLFMLFIVALTGCATPTPPAPNNSLASTPPSVRGASQWVPTDFSQLPGWPESNLSDAWGAMVASCQKPHPAWRPYCASLRSQSLGSEHDKQAWLQTHFQPYQLMDQNGQTQGLLTAYYEPELTATRQPQPTSRVALYKPPIGVPQKAPWYTRQEIDTLPEAGTALQGRELVYISDPIDALILHIQGSGKATIQEPDGRTTLARIAFAATNEQPYKSVAKWLMDQGQLRDTSWAGIRAWATRNPARINDMLWSNPRYVFFREEPLTHLDASLGPKGAQGVALTAGRSIAIDPSSLPYGVPVWIHTTSPVLTTSRLVVTQDTGSAIVGAIRADYFAGSGAAAGELAGRVKQAFQAWVLWPKHAASAQTLQCQSITTCIR